MKNCHRYEEAKEMLLNIKKTKIMASGPITSWQINEEIMQTGTDFILGGSKITHLKRPWCWERLRAGGEGDDRGWDGWMALSTLWTWVWVDSRSWWWTGRPGVLRFMGSQRVGHDWATEMNWTELNSGSMLMHAISIRRS